MSSFCRSQSGAVEYKVVVDQVIESNKPEVLDFIGKIKKIANEQKFKLLFNGDKSSFSEIGIMSSEDSYNLKMSKIASSAYSSDGEVYYDKKNNEEFLKKSNGILIKNTNTILKWEVTADSKTISNYKCYRAVLEIPFVNSKGQSGIQKITAWFAPSLPYSFGPKDFHGLPGLILELNDIRSTFLVTKISLDDKELTIDFPKGKTVTKEDYEKKLKAQMGM